MADQSVPAVPRAGNEATLEIRHVVPHRGSRGDMIGRYRLIELLGEGGMGSVYLSEQLEPMRRLVALKLMHASLGGSSAISRFVAERDALARLSHPNVATMYDADATEDGFPFFVMERVEGLPLADYCDGRALSLRNRISLLIQICKGVQHAHQKGVIHRDLKPSNILVGEVEGRALPKIIDFGIAKAIDHPLGPLSREKTGWAIVGTPAYMSPEALSGSDLDTRTDVYSLGVVLYELLAGVRPHEIAELPLGGVIRAVSENDSPVPRNLFLALEDGERRRIALSRSTSPGALSEALRGDLGWIARKATARDREDRYGSAADLASDLERYLLDEPVEATPPSLRDRTAKFARRHRAVVIAVSLILVALAAAVAGIVVGIVRAQQAREEAEAVSGFLTDLLDSASPWNGKNETTVRELLEQAATKIPEELKEHPAARAQLLHSIGSSQFHLGHLESAESLLTEALRIRMETDGSRSLFVAGIQNTLGLVMKHQLRFSEAEDHLRASLATRDAIIGRVHNETARSLFDLASVLAAAGKAEEAERAYRESLTIRESLLQKGEIEFSDVALTMNGLGIHLSRRGELKEAEALIRRSLGMRSSRGDRGYAYALSLGELGKVLAKQNRWPEAEASHRESLEALRGFVDPSDGRISKAEQLLAEAIEAQRR